MSKERVTKKFLKERFIIVNAGNDNLQNLLVWSHEKYYCTRSEGWSCDAYIFGDYAICNGYDCPGKLKPYEKMKKYDEKARNILDQYSSGSTYYTNNRTKSALNKLIYKFLEEVTTK